MRVKDREIEKVNKHSIKRLEPILDSIDDYEKSLNEDFNNNLSRIFGINTSQILEEFSKTPNLKSKKTRKVSYKGVEYTIPVNILKDFHRSYISNQKLREYYESKLKMWFSDKTDQIKSSIKDVDSYQELMGVRSPAFALASLALTAFHKRPNMVLRDVQKMTGIAISEGDIAELSSGEGKTLSAVLPVFLQALRGKGVHVITSNGYLSKRDFEETLPIYEGLGLTSGYIPDNEVELATLEGKDYNKLSSEEKVKLHKKLVGYKQKSYRKDISYGAKETFAFDYLRDNLIKRKEDMLQREEKPGFALIDEIDDALIDDAEVPYRIAVQTPMYKPNMSLYELCTLQGISYENVYEEVKDYITDKNHLSYEEARFISNAYGYFDLIADPSKYQEAAERFFKMQKVFTVQDNQYGFETAKEVYDALLDDDMYEAESIRSKYGIIFCNETKEFKISDKCFDDFLKYCYFSFQINSQLVKYKDQILKDKNYTEKKDYYITNNGKLRLTNVGADKILDDSNYPDFVNDYNKYLATVSSESATVVHYFKQAVVAHLLMKNGEDYIVEKGKIKTLKNGRIQEDSTYSNGLHQAIELKEGIEEQNRTKETSTSSSITQKEFYSRYDLFSGMTGTSSKKVFGEIFGKGTLEIPKHAFYSYYGKRKLKDAKEPLGVDLKETKFTLNEDDKINLIIKSIMDSHRLVPKQPILIVVSDYDEIKVLEENLKKRNIIYNVLDAKTSKEDEALIISQAGLPGAITISTEMAGRGTDIKIGGDRDTIIDIACERHIKMLEQKQGTSLEFTTSEKCFLREKVEKALDGKLWSKQEEEKNRRCLERIGLKVISSGYFKISRVDKQLEGRTGRNGISGLCERFVCPSDLKNVGISSLNGKDSIETFLSEFKRNPDGLLEIDSSSYEAIKKKIEIIQLNNENEVASRIKESQQLNNYATKMIEEYRDQRRKIICDDASSDVLISEMIEQATDGIISSYILDKDLKKKNLIEPLNKNGLQVDIKAISLEAKQILGISFDPNIVEKSNINILELRDSIIRTAKERRKDLGKKDDKNALLIHNDYMIASIPEILESSFCVKNLVSISSGMEGEKDALAKIKFADTKNKLLYESYKAGLKAVMGIPLSNEEFKDLESRKRKLFSMHVKKIEKAYDVKEAQYQQNNTSVIKRLKDIRKKLDEQDNKEKIKISKKINEEKDKGSKPDILSLCSNLHVRPIKFINTLVSGKRVTKLVLVKEDLYKMKKSVKNASSK